MKFAAFFGKLFNIRSGEWKRLLILYTMSLVAIIGLTWAEVTVQGAFLQLIGVRYLPLMLIANASCSVVALLIYSAFADRVSNSRLLIGLLAISGIGILVGLAGLATGYVKPAFILLYIVLFVPMLEVYNVHWATYVNGFYDIRAAKRIVPVLSTAARVATIIGGLSMPLMNKVLSPTAIMGVLLVCLTIMAALAAALPRLMHELHRRRPSATKISLIGSQLPPPAEPAEADSHGWARLQRFFYSYGAMLREGYLQIKNSPFLRWMAISTFCLPILMVMLNFGASAIIQDKLKTTVAIADFLGVLTGAGNLVILPIQLFLLSRLITRLGLGKASLIYPFIDLAASGSIAIVPGLGTAAFAYLNRTSLRAAFRIPIENLLYNAVPVRVKARTRAFVGGLIIPIGAILGSLLLLTPLVRVAWFLPAAVLVLAAAFLVGSLMVRKYYGKALVDLLEQEDYSSLALQPPSEQEPSGFAVADAATLARLEEKLSKSPSPERAIFMAQLITAVGGEDAVRIVGQAARAAADSRLRASLIEVLVAAEMRQVPARELFAQFLSDPDEKVRLSAISGLEQIYGMSDSHYLEIAAKMLHDPGYDIRLRILPALITSGDPGRRAAGITELRELLNLPDPHIQARALLLVGQTCAVALLPEIVRSLVDPNDEVRLAAALSAEQLLHSEMSIKDREILLTQVQFLLHDPIERARITAVTILGKMSTGEGPAAEAVRAKLVTALVDPSPEMREMVVEILAGAGRLALPQVFEKLTSEDPNLRKMAAVVLAHIEPRRYAPLVRVPHIDTNLRTIYQNLCCAHALTNCVYPAVDLLQRALQEQNAALIDEIFYLLTAIQATDSIRSVASSLRSSQPEVRANAAEALESLTTPQTTALIVPLFEPDLPSSSLVSLARQTWDISIPTPAAAIRMLLFDGRGVWQRTLAAAALAELYTSSGTASDREIAELFVLAKEDPDQGIHAEINTINARHINVRAEGSDKRLAQPIRALSLVEKLILLKGVPFFQGMSTDQLKALAQVCVEERFSAGATIFNPGDAGGAFYIVVSGQIGIEFEKRKGSFIRLATIGVNASFGETDFFDNSRRTNTAIALQDSFVIRLDREPLIAMARQHFDLSLELVSMLSVRLREASERIADLTRSHPPELHKLFDQFT